MKFRWQLQPNPQAKVESLAAQLGVPPLLARLLLQRGIEDPDAASSFLDPRLDALHDPFLMRDMERTVERIEAARERREKVLIYGDYDVDGITSTVVLRRALEMMGMEADFHIPARLKDGYGLQPEVLVAAQRDGFGLAISVDSGIRGFEACRAAREAGLDLIVTDHHVPAAQLPPAYAILNPKRGDCSYPDKDLAAVGVVFKLVQALFKRAGKGSVLPHFLKLVAIGTIADIVPLTGENRIFVKHGLAGLSDPRNVGLRELLSGAGIEGREVSQRDVGFRIVPRINAVTRMGGGREVVDLFSTRDARQARLIVEDMNLKNEQRRGEEAAILRQAEELERLRPQDFEASKRLLVLAGQDWHRGVIGIVASRLVERFNRPVLILSVGEGNTQGSGRSIEDFNLLEALEENAGLFERFGGHAMAVGCSLDVTSCDDPRLQEIALRLDDYAQSRLQSEQLTPRLPIAGYLEPDSIDLNLVDQVERLAPWGAGNPRPVFAAEGLQVAAGPWILKQQHLKFQVQCNGSRGDAIWWKNASAADSIAASVQVEMAFTIGREVYQGESKLLLTVQDVK